MTTVGVMHGVELWLRSGIRETASMIWMTWWPLIFGFIASGFIQAIVPRGPLRKRLSTTTPTSTVLAATLGIISSSCSYAASSMSHALRTRGSSWANSLVFMVASTNIVIELGVVLYVMLGGRFVIGQFVGGFIMVALVAAISPTMFRHHEPPIQRDDIDSIDSVGAWRHRESYVKSARYTMGDLKMLRKELFAGFLVTGFVSAHVPSSWWRHVFMTGHGWWVPVEHAIVAPFIAIVTFVCSVGNIPLAAALWEHGVDFGGVIAFIFADLITMPLLLIYRRYYGWRTMLRLLGLLWFVMSVGGLAIQLIFTIFHAVPRNHVVTALSGSFQMGNLLVANIVATVALIATWILSRGPVTQQLATDPICGMAVEPATATAYIVRNGETSYFCSERCRDRYAKSGDMTAEPHGDATCPMCSMQVDSQSTPYTIEKGNAHYFFCSEGCRDSFMQDEKTHNIAVGKQPS